MMNKRMGTAVAVVALIGLAVGVAMAAQPDHGGPGGPCKRDPKMAEAYKGLFAALKSWGTTTVLPQLREWKGDLDGAMSAEDLRTLNDLRARSAALRTEKAAIGGEMRAARQSDDKAAAEAAHEKMKGLHEKHKAIADELKPLAAKYRSTLEQIGSEAKPKMESWKEEAKAIATKWFEENKSNFSEDQVGRMHHGMKMFGHFGGGRMGHRMVARFMLWDGNNLIDQMDEMGTPGDGAPELR